MRTALAFDGRMFRLAPDGAVDRVVEMPARKVTSVGFGGPALDVPCVTSTAEPPLPKRPGDGPPRNATFAVHCPGARGRTERMFQG